MTHLYYATPKTVLATFLQQMTLQQQLIEAQQKIIDLQAQIEELTPKNPADETVFWHIQSEGVLSKDAATSDDIDLVRRFRDWNMKLAKDHIRPYVSPKVYSEVVNQMTRGLAEHIAELDTKNGSKTKTRKSLKSKSIRSTSHGRPIQLTLLKA